jgi:ATP-dependent Zn protease
VEQNKLPQWWRGSLVYILILIAIVALVFTFLPITKRPMKVDLNTFIEQVKRGEVDTIQQTGSIIIGLKDNQEKIETGFIGSTGELVSTLEQAGITTGENGVKIDVKPDKFDWGNLAISFVPVILVGVLLIFLFRSASKKT